MKDDIDYTEKIKTFNLLVGNNNEEIALNYLTISNWDEDQAAMLYNKENKGADAKLINNKNLINPNNINNNFIPNNNNLDFIPIDYYNFDPPQIINPNAKNNTVKYNSKINTYPHCKIYTKGFFDGIKLWKVDNRGYYESYFKQFENKLKLFKYYDTFINNLKTNIGIIYIYDKSNINTGLNVFRNFINNQQVKELLQKRCIVHPMVNKCCEASDIIKTFKINHFPVMVICFYKNENYFAVIQVVNNIMSNLTLFNEKILEAYDLFNKPKDNYPNEIPKNNNNNLINDNNLINNNNNLINNNNNIINNNNNLINNNNINNNTSKNLLDDPRNYMFDDDIIKKEIPNPNPHPDPFNPYPYMSDGEILKKQEEEMKSLERIEEEKIRKKKREEEEKIKKEQEEKNQKEFFTKQLPEEPSDDDPNKCTIMFRFPDGEKTVQRKFLKTDKISILYIYVKSLGREIYSEQNENNFSLVQPFPFKNFNDLQENTLESEGMFPNAVLQIRVVE